MPTFLSGLPVHVLVVHLVVVLVPAAVLGAVLVTLWPAARRRYGWLVVGVTAVAVLSIPIATESGEGLEHSLPETPALSTHAEMGEGLLPFAGLLLLGLVGLMVLDRVRATVAVPAGPGGGSGSGPGAGGAAASGATPAWTRPVAGVLSVLVLALAVVAAVQVVRIGDSGARAAWGDQQYTQQSTGGDEDGG